MWSDVISHVREVPPRMLAHVPAVYIRQAQRRGFHARVAPPCRRGESPSGAGEARRMPRAIALMSEPPDRPADQLSEEGVLFPEGHLQPAATVNDRWQIRRKGDNGRVKRTQFLGDLELPMQARFASDTDLGDDICWSEPRGR